MPNVKNNVSAQETRRRLIDAAGQVFAAKGLHAATIKEITGLAGVNTAAINYHFSDKYELYAAVIRHALGLMRGRSSAEQVTGSPEGRLRAFIADLIDDVYDRTRPSWPAALLAKEFAQPTTALTSVMDEVIRPRVDFIHAIIRDILGAGASQDQVVRAGMSVSAQCFFLLYNAEIIRRLHPEMLQEGQKQVIADHIATFSLAGLRALRRSLAAKRRPA